MSPSVAFPVQVLREHITGLEAAISVCLADPGHKPIHKLRTETRRIEALLLLLGMVPDLPEHRKQAASLLRTLAKLRRAAGEVRDLDVHRQMLETIAAEKGDATSADLHAAEGKASAKKFRTRSDASANVSGQRKHSADTQSADPGPLADSAAELRKRMGRARDKAAARLQSLLQQRQARTARAAEALLKALRPGEGLSLPASDLLRDAESVLARDGFLRDRKIQDLSKDDLHSVRKAAKAARYVAESLPEDATLVAAAQRFEALQEAGGQWHDALELARAARRYFGKTHQLAATYRDERDRKLDAYRSALGTIAPIDVPPRKVPGRATPESQRGQASAAA